MSMTVKELLEIISSLPDNTPVLVSTEDIYEVETVSVEHHSDGRKHLILSNLEWGGLHVVLDMIIPLWVRHRGIIAFNII